MITNIFTVVVLIHPRMRNSSTHVYLMALSACNIFLLLGLMINYSIKSMGRSLTCLLSREEEDRHRMSIRRSSLSGLHSVAFYAERRRHGLADEQASSPSPEKVAGGCR